MSSFAYDGSLNDSEDEGAQPLIDPTINDRPNLLRRTFWYAQRRYWKQGLAAIAIYTAVMIMWSYAVR